MALLRSLGYVLFIGLAPLALLIARDGHETFLTHEPVFLLAGEACFIATLLLLGFRLTPQSQLDFQS